jgi:hypothetical protein
LALKNRKEPFGYRPQSNQDRADVYGLCMWQGELFVGRTLSNVDCRCCQSLKGGLHLFTGAPFAVKLRHKLEDSYHVWPEFFDTPENFGRTPSRKPLPPTPKVRFR